MNEFTRAARRAPPPPLAAGATIEPMPSTVFTTAGLPARAQFDAWRAFTAPCIEALSRDGVERGFEARSQSWRFDPFLLQHSRLPACGYRRSEAQAERDDLDHWLIGICLRGQHRQRSGDRVMAMAPGLPHVFRTSAAFEAQRDGDEMEWIGLYLPRDAVPELDPALAAAAGAGGLFAWGWMERAGRQIAALEAAQARREVAALQRQIQQMEVRRVEEDRVNREPNPAQRLRDAWTRP